MHFGTLEIFQKQLNEMFVVEMENYWKEILKVKKRFMGSVVGWVPIDNVYEVSERKFIIFRTQTTTLNLINKLNYLQTLPATLECIPRVTKNFCGQHRFM